MEVTSNGRKPLPEISCDLNAGATANSYRLTDGSFEPAVSERMMADNLRWTLRITLMFLAGVVPAVLLFLIILVMMPLMGIIVEFVYWSALMALLALLGIVGLWGATFRDGRECGLPKGITIVLVLFGLLAAVPYLFGLAPDALEHGGFSLLLTFLLLGPIACAVYFLVEQSVLALRRRSGTSIEQRRSGGAERCR